MKVLSINIRATQGGAGRMGYDLHHRLVEMGEDARLLYGYGSRISPDPMVSGEPGVDMLGTRAGIVANYIAHWLTGAEVMTPGFSTLSGCVDWCDVVHIHAAHHWYIRWATLTELLRQKKKPVVITAHDWWLLTGRCGFVRDCTGWHRACGECGNRRFEDLPSLFDNSRQVRVARQSGLQSLRENLVVVCPSQHLQRDHSRIYRDMDVRFIPNAIDREYEAAIERPKSTLRQGIVFCASDLDSPGKIDAAMVRSMVAFHGKHVKLVGRGSLFNDAGATLHGEVRDRRQLAAIFSGARTLVFTSQMDNAPLTIIEALVAGCHVVAYPSPAAAEMLALVGGRCVISTDEARTLINEGREAELYGGLTAHELSAKAREIWSGHQLVKSYRATYAELIARCQAK